MTDADLAVLAAGGDLPAFEELYRRHVQAAWRVAQAVTGNPHDAADAVSDAFTRVFQALPARLQGGENFRPYLLASVRNAAIDVLRRLGRTSPSDNEEVLDTPAVGREPSDLLLADVDSDMVAAAFRTLPERWRTVLWLTEVENMPPREVAVLLGISANGVAQLAVRARAGLRERFLQAHLHKGEVRKECRAAVAKLGAYAGGGLPARDISKVDQHLAGCDACRDRLAELEDLSQTLHRSAPPVPVFLAAAATAKWMAASGAGKVGAGGAGAAGAAGTKIGAGAGAAKTAGAGAGAGAVAAKAGAGAGVAAATSAVGGTASLAVASVALLASGLLGVLAVDESRDKPSRTPRAATSELVAAAPEATDAGAGAPVADPLFDYPVAGVEVPPAPSPSPLGAAPDASGVAAPDFAPPNAGDAQRAIPVMGPVAQLGMWLPGPLAVVLALGESTTLCPGLQAGTVALGCLPEEPADGPADEDVTVGTAGTAVPETEITVPVPAEAPVPAPTVRTRSSMRSGVSGAGGGPSIRAR